jgi:hypothetical protein
MLGEAGCLGCHATNVGRSRGDFTSKVHTRSNSQELPVSYDKLHHFVASGIWDAAPLGVALRAEADAQVGGDDDAWPIIDDSTLPKKGRSSVGLRHNMLVRWARRPTARRWCF